MKTPYRAIWVPSALSRKTFRVTNRACEALLIHAETTPGVVRVSTEAPSFEYYPQGSPQVGTYHLHVDYEVRRERWCVTRGAVTGTTRPELEEARAGHAKAAGEPYRRFSLPALREPAVEFTNRRTMHSLLATGITVGTAQLERELMLRLADGAHRLADLAALARVPVSHVQVAIFRRYLRGHVALPLDDELITDSMLAARCDHATA